jgi:hypothetical protein
MARECGERITDARDSLRGRPDASSEISTGRRAPSRLGAPRGRVHADARRPQASPSPSTGARVHDDPLHHRRCPGVQLELAGRVATGRFGRRSPGGGFSRCSRGGRFGRCSRGGCSDRCFPGIRLCERVRGRCGRILWSQHRVQRQHMAVPPERRVLLHRSVPARVRTVRLMTCASARSGRNERKRQWVGEAGFEPATTSTQSSCTTGLCDSPERTRMV